MTAGRVIGLLVSLTLAGLTYVGWAQWRSLDAPVGGSGKPIPFEVKKGAHLRQIIDDLHKRGLVRAPWALEFYARQANLGRRLRAGQYLIEPT